MTVFFDLEDDGISTFKKEMMLPLACIALLDIALIVEKNGK